MKLNSGVKNWDNGNILELDIPKQLDRTVMTGARWFDEATGGFGLTPSMCGFLTGSPGAGKTTAMLQLADSLMKLGHSAIYNTQEESLYQVRKVVRRLDLKHGFYAMQEEHTPTLLNHATDILKKTSRRKAKDGQPAQTVLIIDSLQVMDDGKYGDGARNSRTPIRVVDQVMNWCKDNFGICLMISQVTKDGSIAGHNALRHAVDFHAKLYFDEDKKSDLFGERCFKFNKNRFGAIGKGSIVGMSNKGLTYKGHFMLPGFESSEEE